MNLYRYTLIICLCLIIHVFPRNIHAQNDSTRILLDNLSSLYFTSLDEKIQIEALDSISKLHTDADSTIKYAQLELQLAKKLDLTDKYANALRYTAWAYYFKQQYDEAVSLLYDAIEVYETLDKDDDLASAYTLLANNLTSLEQYSDANSYYLKALNHYISINDSVMISDTYRLMGHASIETNMLFDAKRYFSKAVLIDKTIGNVSNLADDYYYIGLYYHKLYETLNADSAYNNAYNYYRQTINTIGSSKLYTSLMYTYTSLSELIGIKCYNNSDITEKDLYDISNCIDSASMLCSDYGHFNDSIDIEINRAVLYGLKKDFSRALNILSSLENVLINPDDDNLAFNTKIAYTYSVLYESQGDYKKALQYLKEYNSLMYDSSNDEYNVKSADNFAQLDYNHKFKRYQQIHEAEQKINRLFIYLFGLIIIVLAAISLIIWQNLKKRKQINLILNTSNQTLEAQKEEIQAQNEFLTRQKIIMERQHFELTFAQKQTNESIEYALNIQKATIPSENLISKIFGESFVYFKPLNIVSGDFYWAVQRGRYKLLAVADGTGHGIPGAFMSMLGISILNNVFSINDIENMTAASILNAMRDNLKQALHQTKMEGSNQDSIDIALLIFDMNNMTIQYAGAFRPLWIVRNKTLLEYRGDRMPIGIYIAEKESFTNHVIKIEHGDRLYLFSDGITDQYGYENGELKKFTAKRLRQFLEKNHSLPMNVQKIFLDTLLHDWKVSNDIRLPAAQQTDDITVLGIHII